MPSLPGPPEPTPDRIQPPPLHVENLLDSDTLNVRNVHCAGQCRHRGPEEWQASTLLVFPYRGVYLRHVGGEETTADANQLVPFNADESYRVSHPVAGGDHSLVIAAAPELLHEAAAAGRLLPGAAPRFRDPALRMDARAQLLAARLRLGLLRGAVEPLQAESLGVALLARTVGAGVERGPRLTPGRRRLVDRAKLLIASDPSRRWRLQEIAGQVGSTALYLTQSFSAVEGMPLYRYQLRLRLASALDQLADADNLAALAHDLGFSSHSHISAAFRQVYGSTPASVRAELRHRRAWPTQRSAGLTASAMDQACISARAA